MAFRRSQSLVTPLFGNLNIRPKLSKRFAVYLPDELRDKAVVGDLEVVHQFAHQVGDAPELSEPHLVRENITGGELANLP